MSTDVLEKPDLDIEAENKEPFAHYAESASVTEGYIMGTPVIALCGKVFIPSKNPEKLRVCPICKEIVEALFLSSE
jgi:hypothetical protein